MKNYITITENKLYNHLYKKGKSIVDQYFVLYYKKRNDDKVYLGLTVSKKIGKAVLRNRAKRVLRHAFMNAEVKKGYNYILVSRNKTPLSNANDVANALSEAMKKL